MIWAPDVAGIFVGYPSFVTLPFLSKYVIIGPEIVKPV
jgi:hypothetical protein